MVQYIVQVYLYAVAVRVIYKGLKVGLRAEIRIDSGIVCHIISVIRR